LKSWFFILQFEICNLHFAISLLRHVSANV
jgi:hypothetical protein